MIDYTKTADEKEMDIVKETQYFIIARMLFVIAMVVLIVLCGMSTI